MTNTAVPTQMPRLRTVSPMANHANIMANYSRSYLTNDMFSTKVFSNPYVFHQGHLGVLVCCYNHHMNAIRPSSSGGIPIPHGCSSSPKGKCFSWTGDTARFCLASSDETACHGYGQFPLPPYRYPGLLKHYKRFFQKSNNILKIV